MGMNVVWLKKDVRVLDHAPLSCASASGHPFIILYVYEPEIYTHKSVHTSHLAFTNEGLADMEQQLVSLLGGGASHAVTLMHGEIVCVLKKIHSEHGGIRRLLSHEETGHSVSYSRDRRVRRFCREMGIMFKEFNQTGVTRALKDRDDFSRRYNEVMAQPFLPAPEAEALRELLVTSVPSCGIMAPGALGHTESDRPERQSGGERLALETLTSFLHLRGQGYARNISSPNTSWDSCSRLSAYLTYGHISVRYLTHQLAIKQAELRAVKKSGPSDGWLKSLSAFHSRIRWRSHFMQKLESQWTIEHQAQCLSLDNVRTENGNTERYLTAWCEGKTGFPFVDACMRCMHRHGWLNFRMRAMVVSFAAYNLWLDWRVIAPHLAKLFLDYEPGIHYPQLQMQAGVTGINAMRVYSVVKQSRDQDPNGTFIQKYVPELCEVPQKYVHEPWKMPLDIQERSGCLVGVDYPEPIVDEIASGREAKAVIAAARKTDTAKLESRAVCVQHGSRKRGSEERQASEKKAAPKRSTTKRQKGPVAVQSNTLDAFFKLT